MNSGQPELAGTGIEYLYNPKSIAIIGASPEKMKPGGRPLVALRNRGYSGTVVAVNPKYDDIDGIPCYPSLLDVPDDIELLVLSVPEPLVLETLEQGAKKGVKAAVIFSAGFAEVDEEGIEKQKALTEFARKHGIRLLGPNCLGLLNLTNNTMASFAHIMDLEPVKPQTLAFVTQSGAFGAMIYGEATEAGVGFSSFASVGNEADVEMADCIEYLLTDPHAEVIGGYIEGARDGERLRRVAEKALRVGKPIALLKVGRTGAGARAANSHTGSLAGDDQVYDAFFRQMGIIRINELSELTAFVHLHRSGRNFESTRVAILGGSGGHGVMMSDICEAAGLTVPEISGKTREDLEAILPSFGSAKNPIDLTAQAGGDPTMMGRCLKVLTESDDIDIILMQGFFRDRKSVEEIIELTKHSDKPIVFTARNAPSPDMAENYKLLRDNGLVILPEARQAAKAIADLSWYQRKVRQVAEDDVREAAVETKTHAVADALLAGKPALTEFECKRILE
ncbi:MAG: CoA-binding protein, partial [Pseudomonadales bacterium]|nr:CoA-binding protein [Pseudomonadales bacterium]